MESYLEGYWLPHYADYLLTCQWGRHTERAMKMFVDTALVQNALAQKHAALEGPNWNRNRLRIIGEVDGVHAWRELDHAEIPFGERKPNSKGSP